MRWTALALMALLLTGLLLTDSPMAQYQPTTPPDWEAYEEREDITEAGDTAGAKRVLRFVQVSDAHIIDDDAPEPMRTAAFDDVIYGAGLTGSAARPQEEYTDELLDAMIRAINQAHMEDALDFVINTGDNIDNQLENELMRFLDNWEGTHTTVGPVSDFECLADGQSEDVNDEGNDVEDQCTSLPEGLAANNTPLVGGLPWFSAFGNHDGLIQGNVPVEPSFDQIAEEYGRYFLRQHEYVDMHFATGGRCVQDIPQGSIFDDWGHGYGFAGPRLCDEEVDNDGYYAFDHRGIRFVVLDTVNDDFVTGNENLAGQFNPQTTLGYDIIGGYAEGSIDPAQWSWLTNEVQNNQDKLIVIFSHHTVNSMFTKDAEGYCEGDQCLHHLLQEAGYKTGTEVKEFLTEHDHVVAWIGGHTHRHRIEPKSIEGNPAAFWNVESSSIVDMPQQSRAIEVWVTADGSKGYLRLDRLDHDYELGRQLAMSDEQGKIEPEGTSKDQDVLLWFDIPSDVQLLAQPSLARFLVLQQTAPVLHNGSHGHVGEPVTLELLVKDNLFQAPVAGLNVSVDVRHANKTGGSVVDVADAMLDAGEGRYTFTFTPVDAATHFVDYTVTDPTGTYEDAGRLSSLVIQGDEEPDQKKGKKSPLPVVLVMVGLLLAMRRQNR